MLNLYGLNLYGGHSICLFMLPGFIVQCCTMLWGLPFRSRPWKITAYAYIFRVSSVLISSLKRINCKGRRVRNAAFRSILSYDSRSMIQRIWVTNRTYSAHKVLLLSDWKWSCPHHGTYKEVIKYREILETGFIRSFKNHHDFEISCDHLMAKSISLTDVGDS